MCTLLVKDFGPIHNLQSVVVEMRKVTVFCGRQGAGKSTIAKLLSMFNWLEKSLMRGDTTIQQLTRKGVFTNSYCSFHNIQNYFKGSTILEFVGTKYKFRYQDGELAIDEISNGEYRRPQIMYIPSERNFMASIEHADKISNLPAALSVMQKEYAKALKSMSETENQLPIKGYSVEHDSHNGVTWISKGESKICITEAASGFQSLVPLVLVSRYLNDSLQKAKNGVFGEESAEESLRYEKMISDIINDKNLDDETKSFLIRNIGAVRKNVRFVNIVEELEQNLFPESQREVLYFILGENNATEGNQLILTTHSPYLISYLSLAVKAKEVYGKAKGDLLKTRVSRVVPQHAFLSDGDVAFYEITDKGDIYVLPTFKGMPDDENVLNLALGDIGNLYEELVDIEDLCNQ